jgi:hypothetical protein
MIADCLMQLAPMKFAAEGNRFDLCAGEPKSLAEVKSKSLGHKVGLKIASPVKNKDGYAVTIPAIADGQLTGKGTVSHWAVTSGSELLMTYKLAEPESVKSGNKFELPSFEVRFPRATADMGDAA